MEQPSPTENAPRGVLPTTLARTDPGRAGDVRTWLDVSGSLMGLHGELDPLSSAVLARALDHFSRAALRYDGVLPADRGLVGVFDSRVHLNISALLGLLRPDSLAQWVSEVDPLAAPDVLAKDVLATDDLRERQLLPGLLMRGARALAAAVAGQLQPAWSRSQADEAWEAWEARIERRASRPIADDGFSGWIDRLLAPTAQIVVDELIPRIALATTACRAVREPFQHRPEYRALLDAVPRALDGSSVCSLVLDLAEVARLDAHDPAREKAWNDLMRRHGHRGVSELSLLGPRFSECAVPEQLAAMLRHTPDLARRWERAAQARKLAVSTLAADLPGPLERARFLAAAEVVAELGGLSDAPLAALVRVLAPIRQRLRTVLEQATQAGRIDWQDVPHLSIEGIDALRRGEPPRFVEAVSVPGVPVQARLEELPLAVVPGKARGRPIHPQDALAQTAPMGSRVLVTEVLAPWMAPLIGAAAGVVITGRGGFGPSVAVARAFGRPCVLTGATVPMNRGLLVDADLPDVRPLG